MIKVVNQFSKKSVKVLIERESMDEYGEYIITGEAEVTYPTLERLLAKEYLVTYTLTRKDADTKS